MKTWLIPLDLLLLLSLLLYPLESNSAELQEGVIVQKIGSGFIFIFPSTQGRIVASSNPAGKITIGNTITVAYALKIIRGSRARFIGIDGSPIPPGMKDKLKPKLSLEKAPDTFGFIIKDSQNPKLDITISPSFMSKVKAKQKESGIKEAMAREGNLTVIVGISDKNEPVIVAAILD